MYTSYRFKEISILKELNFDKKPRKYEKMIQGAHKKVAFNNSSK